jgi:hypothetical protein
MTYWQWQQYGPEGPPPEECNNDPVSVVESVVNYLTCQGFDDATKKKVRDAMNKGLRLRRGRHEGSGLKEHTLEGFELYGQGYTEHQIGEHFRLSADELKKLMARIRAKKSKLPKDERRTFALARLNARSMAAAARKHAPAHKRKAPAPASGS